MAVDGVVTWRTRDGKGKTLIVPNGREGSFGSPARLLALRAGTVQGLFGRAEGVAEGLRGEQAHPLDPMRRPATTPQNRCRCSRSTRAVQRLGRVPTDSSGAFGPSSYSTKSNPLGVGGDTRSALN